MIADSLIAFCRFLRERGSTPGAQQTLDALRAAELVNPANRDTLKAALKLILSSSKEEWDQFDGLFEQYWSGRIDEPNQAERTKLRGGSSLPSNREPEFRSFAESKEIDQDDAKLVAGASLEKRLRLADFSTVTARDLPELDRLALHLLSVMSSRLSRRFRGSASSGRLDLRATLRRSLPAGGTPVDLRWKKKKPRPLRLIILIDVSGSMNPYSVFLLKFAYALAKRFPEVRAFLFSTSIQEITSELRSRQLKQALDRLSRAQAEWAGGTRIGESLRQFLAGKGGRLLTQRSAFLILSDGWDTGDPGMLAKQLAVIQRRVRQLIWLTPLLGMDGYQPLTRALNAALPFIDVFAPAHNLDSLLDLERHLHVRSIS